MSPTSHPTTQLTFIQPTINPTNFSSSQPIIQPTNCPSNQTNYLPFIINQQITQSTIRPTNCSSQNHSTNKPIHKLTSSPKHCRCRRRHKTDAQKRHARAVPLHLDVLADLKQGLGCSRQRTHPHQPKRRKGQRPPCPRAGNINLHRVKVCYVEPSAARRAGAQYPQVNHQWACF